MPFVNQLEPETLMRQFIAHPPRDFSAQCLPDSIPAFTAPFDLLTTAEPALRLQMARWPLYRYWRHWLRLRARFIGTTVTEYVWFPADADPAALAMRLRASQATHSPLLVIKDIPHESPLLDAAANTWADAFVACCADQGFVILEGQALAWVPIDFTTTDEYLARLSRSRRRNIRRKLRSRANLHIEQVPTGATFADDSIVDTFHALYRNVYAQSELHFDFLGRDFLAAVLRDAENRGMVFVYRHDGRMIGWNLCFEHGDALVDKYMGLAYPQARDHNLYAISWMQNLEYARGRGVSRYIAGWSDPQVKAQLGARFTFTRHAVYLRSRVLRIVFRKLARHFESDHAWYKQARHEETHATADP